VFDGLTSWAVTNSDPANLMLLVLIYWRIDRRLDDLRQKVEDNH